MECQSFFVVFVDLCKAYDGVDRTALFGTLVNELGVVPGVIATLFRMYADVQAQFLHGSELSGSFLIRLGVLQGCPSSPAMFSLFIDRLELFLDKEAATSTMAEVEAVLCAGLVIDRKSVV